MKTVTSQSFSALLVLILLGCGSSDPAVDVRLKTAPPEARTFFQAGIENGILYAYLAADGEIFVYRRDLDQFGWVTLRQFSRLIAHAKSRGGYLVYSLEDGDLKQQGCRDAFQIILDAKLNTQDPVDVLPLVKQELQRRRKG